MILSYFCLHLSRSGKKSADGFLHFHKKVFSFVYVKYHDGPTGKEGKPTYCHTEPVGTCPSSEEGSGLRGKDPIMLEKITEETRK